MRFGESTYVTFKPNASDRHETDSKSKGMLTSIFFSPDR